MRSAVICFGVCTRPGGRMVVTSPPERVEERMVPVLVEGAPMQVQ